MWEDLTLKQKAEIMKMSVAGGVTDIDSIRKLYNDSIIDNSNRGNMGMSGSSATLNNPIRPTEHRFDKGGRSYQKWLDAILQHKGIDLRNDYTYDAAGYYNNNPDAAWDMLKQDSNVHFPDEYKTVNHPTFSTYSNYSGKHSIFNPMGLTGGEWLNKHTYKLSKDQYHGPVSVDETFSYLLENENNGVQILDSNGKFPTLEDGSIWGPILPNINVVRQKALGGHLFNKGGQTTKKPQPTYQYGLIEQALIEGGAGGYFKVTSAQRKANAAGHAGNSSAHTYTLADGSPAALDIVPNGISWDEFFTIMSTPQMQASLSKYGFDVLNETSAQMMRSTGATGPHLHVGKGIKGQSGTGQIYGGGSYGGYEPWSAAGSNDSALELMSQRRRMRPIELKSTQQDFLLDYLQSANQAPFTMETPKSVEKPTNNTIPKKETSVFTPTDFGLTPKDNNQVTTDPTTAKRNIEYGLGLENNALWNSPYLLFNNSNDYLV